VAAWGIGFLGLVVVAWLPNVYEASARIYVDGSSVLRPLLTNRIVEQDVATSLAYARQALLGREYLQRVVAENGLNEYADAVTETAQDKVLEQLSEDIVIWAFPADPGNRLNPSTIFQLTYRHQRPEVAEGVVRSFMTILIDDTLGANREGTDKAARFLDDRIAEHEVRLSSAEEALAEFQRVNSGTLPGSEVGYFERIQREKEALEKTRRDLRLAESRRDRLQQQLTSEVPLVSGDPALNRELRPDSIDARIRAQRAELDRLLLQYTDRHPEVVARRESLERLEAQRTEQLRSMGITDPNQQVSALGANPVFQAVQIAVNQAEVEIATLEADIRDRERQLRELQALVDKVPGMEAELARLNRDYNVVKSQYQALVQSRETQQLSQQAEKTDEVDFRILNPPRSEPNPVAPKRLLLLVAVLAVALGAGAALTWVLSQLRPVFSSARALREISGFPVIGSISRVFIDPQLMARRRHELASFSAAIAGLVLLVGVVVVYELVGPGVHSLLGGA